MRTCLFCIILFANTLFAQEFVPRNNYEALLEPKDQVIHGVGQSKDAHLNYWNVMLENQKPSVIMTYIGLKGISSSWSLSLKNEILSYQPNFIIPQIGLSMTSDGTPSAHYEGDVAAGLMDTEIDALIEGLRLLATPAYLRIGYEFNGLSWNGYQPATYKQAFIRITQKIRAAGLEVATVWDAAVGGNSNYMPYYPGDDVVDWWGINPFTVADISHSTLTNFLKDANLHQKPVLIGESTPQKVGVLQGEISWNKWFVPYFNLIHTNAGLKMSCYINWNWAIYPQWADWGDCRLEMNSVVANHYNDEMKLPAYLHAKSEQVFRSSLAYTDQTAPSEIQNLQLLDTIPLQFSWSPVSDSSGLSHYIVYDENGIADYTLEPQFQLRKLYSGQRMEYKVSAMDRAGNESQPTKPLVVQVPAELEKLSNGSFENGLVDWNTDVWGGSAIFDTEFSSPISGSKSAHIKVTQSSGTAWHIQLRQWLQIKKGFTYRISYQARASKNLNMQTWLQMDQDPYSMYSSYQASLTTQVKTFNHVINATADDKVYLEFVLGAVGTAEIWIDDVSLVEVNPNGISTISNPQSFKSENWLGQNYPNPASENTTIEIKLATSGKASVFLYNQFGQKHSCLADQYFTAGSHQIICNTSKLADGIYFYTLHAGNYTEIRKLIVNQSK